MTISRTDTTIKRGPATVTYDGVTFYTTGGITIRTSPTLFGVPVDGFGPVDQRISQIVTEISFTPSGIVSASPLSKLFPHTQCNPGVSAMPATDKTLVVWPLNGKEKLTYSSAFVSKMPDLILSPTKPAFGPVTFTAVGNNNEAWSAAAHLVATADATFSDTSLTAAAHKTVAYTAALGALSAPWNSIQTRDGWQVSFEVGLQPEEVDDTGIYDYLYTGAATIRARCKPIGVAVADLHALMYLQDTGMVRGRSILGLKQALVITGASGGVVATLNNMTLQTAPHQYRDLQHRVEDLEFLATRSLTTGALDALFTLAVAS
jgi:hypothetical protein